jgi:hypothetical protein
VNGAHRDTAKSSIPNQEAAREGKEWKNHGQQNYFFVKGRCLGEFPNSVNSVQERLPWLIFGIRYRTKITRGFSIPALRIHAEHRLCLDVQGLNI